MKAADESAAGGWGRRPCDYWARRRRRSTAEPTPRACAWPATATFTRPTASPASMCAPRSATLVDPYLPRPASPPPQSSFALAATATPPPRRSPSRASPGAPRRSTSPPRGDSISRAAPAPAIRSSPSSIVSSSPSIPSSTTSTSPAPHPPRSPLRLLRSISCSGSGSGRGRRRCSSSWWRGFNLANESAAYQVPSDLSPRTPHRTSGGGGYFAEEQEQEQEQLPYTSLLMLPPSECTELRGSDRLIEDEDEDDGDLLWDCVPPTDHSTQLCRSDGF